MKATIERLLTEALAALPPELLDASARAERPEVERTRDPAHGDYASNVALRHAKAARSKPRELAAALIRALPPDPAVARVEIAGPGFINFHLAPAAYHAELGRVLDAGAAYGRAEWGGGERVLLEFVSANPTGPLHVGHGRHAAYGSVLGALLGAVGYAVKTEFYINDAGRQVDIMAASVWLRYLEALGESVPFPSNGYKGAYLLPIARSLAAAAGDRYRHAGAQVARDLPPDAPAGDKDAYVDAVIARARALLGSEGFRAITEHALEGMLADIREDLAEMGVTFDRWFSERSLATGGAIDEALKRLERQGNTYR